MSPLDSEALFRTLFEQAPMGVALIDSQTGQIREANRRFAEIVGRTREDLSGTDRLSITHPDDLQAEREPMARMKAGDIPGFQRNQRYLRPDGSTVWVSMAVAPIRVDAGQGPHHLCMVEDITQRLRMEQELAAARQAKARQDSQHRFEAVVEQTIAGFAELGLDLRLLRVNERLCEIAGYQREDMLGLPLEAFAHADDRAFFEAHFKALLAGEKPEVIERRLRRKDGSFGWVSAATSLIRDDEGRPVGFVALVLDVTKHRQQELDNIALQQQRVQQDQLNQQLHQSLAEVKQAQSQLKVLSKALEQTPTSVVITDVQAQIEYVNPHFTVVSGYTFDEVRGQNPRMLQSELTPSATYEAMWACLMRGDAWTGELFNRRKSGEVYCEEAHIAPVRDEQGRTTHYVAVKLDITERKQAQERLAHLAYHDVLTNLPNRSLFGEHVAQSLRQAHRERSRMAVLFIDLDKFKPVNDTWGHAVGDQLLQEVATRMTRCVRAADIVGRIGGDEFVVLLRQVRDVESAVRMADKIRNALNEPFVIARHTLFISSSIGVALYPEHGLTGDELVHKADLAMYHAKQDGRDRVLVFDPAMPQAATPSA